jgi:hypothetical protein
MFKPGKSGNPAGRPKGSGVTGKLRKTILDKSPELLQMIVDKALNEQDATAALALLNKVLPNLKAASEPIAFTLNTDAGLSEQAAAIVENMAAGKIPADTGGVLINALSALGKLKELDELEQRLQTLEEKYEHETKN